MAASKSVVLVLLVVAAVMLSLQQVVVGQDDQGPPIADCPTFCHANCHYMPKFFKFLCYESCLVKCYYIPITTPLSEPSLPTTPATDGDQN